MSKINISYKNAGPISILLSVIFSVLFVVTVVQAATTIGSNINTGGTVSVTGLSTFGNASSTLLSVYNNAYFGATATSSFSSVGALTLVTPLTSSSGGTGIANNAASTLTISGNFGTTLTVTGTTALTLPTSGTLITTGSALGTPASGVATNLTGLPLTTGVTGILPTANGGTASAFFTVAGPTAARIYTFPDAAMTVARTDAANTFTGIQTMTSPALTTPTIGGGATITKIVTGTCTAGVSAVATLTCTPGGTLATIVAGDILIGSNIVVTAQAALPAETSCSVSGIIASTSFVIHCNKQGAVAAATSIPANQVFNVLLVR